MSGVWKASLDFFLLNSFKQSTEFYPRAEVGVKILKPMTQTDLSANQVVRPISSRS